MRLRSARRRRLLVVLACLWLAGCGGGFPSGLPTGFINQTQHSDTELWAIWKTAQQELAQEVDLNPLQQSLYDAPANIRPGDARAMSAKPHQLLVAAQPDVASSVLFGMTGVQRADPTGLIACPAPCNVPQPPIHCIRGRSRNMPLPGSSRATTSPAFSNMSLRTRFWPSWDTA